MAMRVLLRHLYHALVPLPLRRRLRLTRFTASRRTLRRVWEHTGGCVAAGPFAGLRLISADPGDCEGPVLLGSFECELHEWLEREIARGWPVVVNIGSATGYYSSGLARRLPNAVVYAFDLDAERQDDTRHSAEANGVAARVRVHGAATIAEVAGLPEAANSGALVVCDCEGCERDLLDPTRIPWLVRSALCIELHDFAAEGASRILWERFVDSHECVVVEQRPREAAAWAARAGISTNDAALLSEEGRSWGAQQLSGRWLLATPR